MTYKFKFKRKWFWRSINVVGHNYLPDQDKMVLFKEDGSLEEIVRWRECSVTLGTDWVAFVKKRMETEAGTAVPLNLKDH